LGQLLSLPFFFDYFHIFHSFSIQGPTLEQELLLLSLHGPEGSRRPGEREGYCLIAKPILAINKEDVEVALKHICSKDPKGLSSCLPLPYYFHSKSQKCPMVMGLMQERKNPPGR